MRPALAAALLIVLAVSVKAEEKPACERFKWPLAMERSWFEAETLQDLQSGAAVDKLAEGAFTVTLKPSTDVGFTIKPQGKPKPDKPLAALLSFGAVAAPGPGWQLSAVA